MVLQLGGKEAQDIQVELVKHGCGHCGASLVIKYSEVARTGQMQTRITECSV
jgi:hypothetical protein